MPVSYYVHIHMHHSCAYTNVCYAASPAEATGSPPAFPVKAFPSSPMGIPSLNRSDWGLPKTPPTLFLISYWHASAFPPNCSETMPTHRRADYPTCIADRPQRSITIFLLKGDSGGWLLLLYSACPGWDIFSQLAFSLSPCVHLITRCPFFTLLVLPLLTKCHCLF